MQSTNPESTVIPSQTSTNNYLSRRVTPGAGGPLINWPKGVAGDDEPDWVLDALGLLASTVACPATKTTTVAVLVWRAACRAPAAARSASQTMMAANQGVGGDGLQTHCRPLGLPDHDGSESGGGRRWSVDPRRQRIGA